MHALAEAPDKGIPYDHIATTTVRGERRKSPDDILWEKFGKSIADLQRQSKLSDAQLAQKAGISADTLGRVKAGATVPSYATLKGLRRALHFRFIIAGHKIP